MTYKAHTARPAVTAIAVVLAATATPAMAQSTPQAAEPAPVLTNPVTVAPAPAAAPAPIVSPAPTPTATPRRPVAPVEQPQTAVRLPEIDAAPARQATAADASTSSTTTRRQSAQSTAEAPRPSTADADNALTTADGALAMKSAVSDKPKGGFDLATTDALPAAEPQVEIAAAPANEDGAGDIAWALLIGAFGITLAGGAIIAVRRRGGRNEATVSTVPKSKPPVTPVAAAMPDPEEERRRFAETFAAVPEAKPVETHKRKSPARVGRAPVISGSAGARNLAREEILAKPSGYFEEMAEQGPTAENPFLTRKNRMKRAHFYEAIIERAARRDVPAWQPDRTRVRTPDRELADA